MNDKKIENYLARLEKALGQIPVSEKAEIIIEIRSHILDTLSSSDKPVSEVLASLGSPEKVASRYLLERGIKPPSSSIMSGGAKWLLISILSVLGVGVVLGFFISREISPIVSVDESEGRVKVLGGLIDVKKAEGNVELMDMDFERLKKNSSNKFIGQKEISPHAKSIFLDFKNIKLDIENGKNDIVEYECYLHEIPKITEEGKGMSFDFTASQTAYCDFDIPKGVDIIVNAQNGKFEFDELRNNLDFKAVNGMVEFSPRRSSHYKYNLSLKRGLLEEFKSSDAPNAYQVNISLVNGKIGH